MVFLLQVMCFAKLNKPPLSFKPPPPSKVLEKKKPPWGLNRGFTVFLSVCKRFAFFYCNTFVQRLGRKTQTFSGTNHKPERRRPFGTGLVRHCPQGLFSPFFTFLRAIFFRPFRFSLAPTICPWVSEDENSITQGVNITAYR